MALVAISILVATLSFLISYYRPQFVYRKVTRESAESVNGPGTRPIEKERSSDDLNKERNSRSRPSQPRTSSTNIPTITESMAPSIEVQSPFEAASQTPMESSRSKVDTATNLMPPPPPPRTQPTSNSTRNTLSATGTLRIPSNGPLPNRLPTATSSLSRPNSTFSSSLNPASTSTLAPSARPRKKVILKPGHSPLDWASLTQEKSTKELSGVPYPQRITPSQLAYNTGRKGKPAWSSYKGKVYNISPYLPFHPGGEGELMKAAGRDGSQLFDEIHPWVNWENMMGAYLVGFLVQEVEGGKVEDDMEEQD